MMLERSRETVVFYGIHLNLEKTSGVCFFFVLFCFPWVGKLLFLCI
uniref:Uncharacterized protein n=1 Tax=Anguilla anguilla TaxID=7936 RepID=A0A0E9QG07_ANGAN